jgi:acyl dehydratase
VTPSVITDAVRAQIGQETDAYSFDVEAGDLVRFALAAGETNAAFIDPVAARGTPFGGLVAAPTYLIVMRILQGDRQRLENPLPNSVDGGTVWEYGEPIRPGDRITARARLADVFEKPGRHGLMLFQVVEIRYENQFGQLVATQRDTYIRF